MCVVLLVALFPVGCVNSGTSFKSQKMPEKEGAKPVINTPSILPLGNEDFVVKYNGFIFSDKVDASEMFSKLGKGTTNEGNNDGHVSGDYNQYGYPKDSPQITVTTKAWSAITQIEFGKIGTKRGLKNNDSYDKMINLYGIPSEQKQDEHGYLSCYYYFYSNQLLIHFNKDKIVDEVQILYNQR